MDHYSGFLLLQMKNPQDARFFTNRALCNMKLKRWSDVLDDCRLAMEIDRSSVKSYFFLGIAQLEQELYDEAIINLKKGKLKDRLDWKANSQRETYLFFLFI